MNTLMKRTGLALGFAALSLIAPQWVMAQEPEDAPAPRAQPVLEGRPWYVAPMLTTTLPDHARGTQEGFGGAVAVGKALTDGLALELTGFYTSMDAESGGGSAKLYGGGLAALVFPSTRFPYFFGLLGASYGSSRDHPGPEPDFSDGILDTGAGVLYPIRPRLLLRGDFRFRLDAISHNRAGTAQREDRAFYDDVFHLGVLLPFGAQTAPAAEPKSEVVAATAPDSDNDGVADDRDRCPGTPAGAQVDANGCEQDTDGDGVPDRADKCPGTPPGTAVNSEGCPLDSDGDGVPDASDDCPNTPAGAKVLNNGCTLVADCRQARPGESVDENGCAMEKKFVLRGVKFDFDSARLTPEAKEILVDVAATLNAYPEVTVEVQGHTCNVGTPEYNLGLSERRAASAMKFLVEQGIPAARMTAKGYGLTQPIDTNSTEEGRENNRRVELKVLGGDAAGVKAVNEAAAPMEPKRK